MRVPPEEFEALVERALDQLPEQFAELLENVAVVVADEPDAAILEEMGFDPGEELLGLYTGVPQTEREVGYFGLPDHVSIFRGPLCRYCRSRRELILEIRDTVVHELGHHFGLSDEEMPY
ncbi:MAG: metallopeptidase family protein [Thermoanaerobaculia bacterium]|nr:metallopeptidase family protein [Thermoanaerobaculia bacterium]